VGNVSSGGNRGAASNAVILFKMEKQHVEVLERLFHQKIRENLLCPTCNGAEEIPKKIIQIMELESYLTLIGGALIFAGW
jgi:hypothetical protein